MYKKQLIKTALFSSPIIAAFELSPAFFLNEEPHLNFFVGVVILTIITLMLWSFNIFILSVFEIKNTEIVEELIKAGANLNVVGINGFTPILLASHEGYNDIVKKLIQANVDLDTRDDFGDSVLIIESRKYINVLKFSSNNLLSCSFYSLEYINDKGCKTI